MNLWGVAVLELDSHPDNNKGPDHALVLEIRLCAIAVIVINIGNTMFIV